MDFAAVLWAVSQRPKGGGLRPTEMHQSFSWARTQPQKSKEKPVIIGVKAFETARTNAKAYV